MAETLNPETEQIDENILRAEKRRKLEAMRAEGINPYPYRFDKNSSTTEILQKFESLQAGEKNLDSKGTRVAGRLMARRIMGKASFLNIRDESGDLQLYMRVGELPSEDLKVFELLEIGDIIGVEGFVFRTQKGELSLHCERLTCLSKSLEPLPEKFHGIADVEIKYRHRHLDLIMSHESREVFKTRSKIIKEIRSYLDDAGFLEVETPILQPIYGGAAAKPFTTHHNTLDMQLYLKISPELYLKRLIVGGFEKVYDLNRNFRNEGIDRSHNPEFTMIEWYEAYTDYFDQMVRFENLVAQVSKAVRGTTKFEYQGREIDFTPPWPRLKVIEEIKKKCGLDPYTLSDGELFKLCRSKGVAIEAPLSTGEMVMKLFEVLCEPDIWHPSFIMDFPLEVSPLTKIHREDKRLVERFEPYAAGMEIGNSYSELNDPVDQRERLKQQESQRAKDEEAHPMDEDFLHAIDVGMPPTGGVGLGVERLVMILTDRPSIRDIILFPTMKFKR